MTDMLIETGNSRDASTLHTELQGQVGQGAELEEVRIVEHGLSLYYGFHGKK